jgi:hypothetical protein
MARNSDAIYSNHVIHKVMVIKVLLGLYSNIIKTQRHLLASENESTVHVKEGHRFERVSECIAEENLDL